MVEHERTGPMDMLTWTFSRIAMWAPAFIIVIIFYEVVSRYFLFRPTSWVNEMSLWIGGAIYVTSGLYSLQQRSHIRIFVIYDVVPLWLRRLFDLISVLCVCIFAFAVIWGGFGEAVAKYWRWETSGSNVEFPIPATNKPLILLTLLVLALQAISNLIRDWPSIAPVRKIFDILTVALVGTLVALALAVILDTTEAGPAMPPHWRIAVGVALVFAIGLMVYGLIKDFNRTPVPQEYSSDPAAELDLPPGEEIPAQLNDKNN